MHSIENFNKPKIDYLRLSVTDRCNLRCAYCMPSEGIQTVGPDELLSFEETLRLVNIFAGLGTRKIRFTGGEPLVRKGIVDLVRSVSKVPGIEDVALTTNGVLLPVFAEKLKEAGVERLNISLDTLSEEKFRHITRNNSLKFVMDGIDKAIQVGFKRLKLNMVVMKGVNDNEVADFVDFALEKNITLRFIEFMQVTPLWNESLFVPVEEIKRSCSKRHRLEYMENPGPSPAEYYKIQGKPMVGFIKTDQKNCKKCSRLRVTSTGQFKICLYETPGMSLRELLRDGTANEEIIDMLHSKIHSKDKVDYSWWKPNNVYMSSVGG